MDEKKTGRCNVILVLQCSSKSSFDASRPNNERKAHISLCLEGWGLSRTGERNKREAS